MSFKKLFVLLVVLGLALSISLMAQNVVTGDIVGTVTDSSGAVVPKATVTAKNNGNGASATSITSSTGLYHFPLLQPGTYTITAAASGMQNTTRQAEVLVGQVNTVNIQLGVQGGKEVVEITAGAPLLQTENANIASTYNTQQINTLPNPGGDITNIAQTSPGVLMNVGTGFGYGNFQAFGLPGTANLFTVNGNDINDPFLNLNNSGSSNLLLGTNELQQAVVVSNGYTGQYGRQAGVQEDAVTKSGTNGFHGDLNYEWNGSSLNANDWFHKQSQILSGNPNQNPFANSNQYAADLGGPIFKDKTFFYADTEGLRYILPSTAPPSFALPSPAFESFVLGNLAATGKASAVPFYTNMFNLYNAAPGAAGAAGVPGSCGAPGAPGTVVGFTGDCLVSLASASGKNLNREWLYTVRIDQNIGNNDKLFGRYKMDHGSQPTGTSLINPAFSTQSIQPQWDAQINETHIFSPNAVNQVIISGFRYGAVFLSDSPSTAYNLFPTSMSVGSSALASLGVPAAEPQGRNSFQYSGIDDFSLQRGNHNLKMGVNFRRNDYSDFDSQINTHGTLTVGSLNDFANDMLGANGSYSQAFTSVPEAPLGYYSAGVYFQDEWRATPNLKLTMTLRADRNSNVVCQKDCFSRLANQFPDIPTSTSVAYNSIIQSGQHRAFADLEKVVMQPRFGMAWTPFGHSSTVIRGGAGIFSDLYPGVLVDAIASNSPTANTFTVSPSTLASTAAAGISPADAANVFNIAANSNAAFLSGFNGGLSEAAIAALDPFFAPPGFTSTVNSIRNPKYAEWNLEVQHSFGSNTVFDVNYVGTHGYDLFVANGGLNAFISPTLAALDPAFNALPSTVPNGNFGTVNLLTNNGKSNYNGVVTRLERRMGYGFQGSINYTYSHSLDDVSNGGVLPYNLNPNTVSSGSVLEQINPFNLTQLNYGNSDYDVRHNITANYIWTLPYKFQNGFAQAILGGWELAGTVYAASGRPYTPVDLLTGAVIGNLPFDFPGGAVVATSLGAGVNDCSRPVYAPTATNPINQVGCLNASAFAPALSESNFGNMARNQFRGPAYFNTDFTVDKNFKVTERVGLRLGATAYNVLNHPNFALPYGDVSGFFGPQFGSINATDIPPTSPYGSFQGSAVSGRVLQLTGKITF